MSRLTFASAVPSALSLLALMSAGSAEAAAFSLNVRYDGTDHLTSVNANYQHNTFAVVTDPAAAKTPPYFGIYASGSKSCTTNWDGTNFSLGDCVGAMLAFVADGTGVPATSEVFLVAAGASQTDLNAFYNDIIAASAGTLFQATFFNWINAYQTEGVTGPLLGYATDPVIATLDFGAPVSSPAPMVLLGTGLLALVGSRRRAV